MDILLGLDLGTTNCKLLAIDADGQPVTGATAPTPVWAGSGDPLASPEYDAEALWVVCAQLIRQITDALKPKQRVAAVAVASMGESGVLVDANGTPLAPILTWHDRRTRPWAAWWSERIQPVDIYRTTGLPLDYIYSANKLLWHRAQNPLSFAHAHSWLCLADWITFRLTGKRTTTYSMASRTMLFDLRARTWSEPLLHIADLSTDLLPQALPSGQLVSGVTSDAASSTGLPTGTPVVTGGHDHICAALAGGVIAPGSVLDSTGTAEAIMITLRTPILEGDVVSSGLCCGCHTVPDRYYLLGGVMGGAIVNWLSRFLIGDDSPVALHQLQKEAASAPRGANGIWFLPHLGGSGPPSSDPEAWGAWLGLRLNHTRADMARAAMEGLSFSIYSLLEGTRQIAGFPIHELRTVGGGTRNNWWQKLKADLLGVSIEVPKVTDVTAQGAALLAGIGIGIFDGAEAAATAYRPAFRFDSDPGAHADYDAAYRNVYLKLHPALKMLPIGGK